MKSRQILWLIILVLVFLGGGYLYFTKDSLLEPNSAHDFPNPILKIGSLAPNLMVKDVEGKEHKLSDFKGKVVLINFWASWCPPCLIEMPSLASAYQKFKEKGFEILAINLDDKVENAIDFAKKEKIPFKIFLDPSGKSAQDFLVYGLPYTVLLDREGKVRYKVFGGYEWDKGKQLERIQSLL